MTAEENPIARKTPKRGSAFFGRWLLAAPPLALATATITGLGILRGVPTGLAFMVGLVLALLPTLGLGVLVSPRRSGPGWLAWPWCLLVLVSLPLYFPGERESATEVGVESLASWMGDDDARAIAQGVGAWVTLLGPDPKPLAPQNAEAQSEGMETTPELPPPAPARNELADPGDPESTVRLGYRGDANSLRIEIEIDGPEIGEAFTLLFDTGATFTTLDRTSLDAIGIAVGPDAPQVSLQTANGKIEADLVLVDAVWLGESPVEWVTVAVCDRCVNPPAVGLLGLNVSQRFQVSLDHDRQVISFDRRQRGDDRSLDIRYWLRIHSKATETWNGGVEIELTGFNDSRREIRSAVVDLDCSGAIFAIQLDEIPAFGEAVARVELPRNTDCRKQTLELSRAYWGLDRFQ